MLTPDPPPERGEVVQIPGDGISNRNGERGRAHHGFPRRSRSGRDGAGRDRSHQRVHYRQVSPGAGRAEVLLEASSVSEYRPLPGSLMGTSRPASGHGITPEREDGVRRIFRAPPSSARHIRDGQPDQPCPHPSPPARGRLSTAHLDSWRAYCRWRRHEREGKLGRSRRCPLRTRGRPHRGRDGPGSGSRKRRLLGDLSAQPHVCNPTTVGSRGAGSQTGSQHRRTVTDAG
jgi:hypothetical protein